MDVRKWVVEWSGWQGQPGYSTFYGDTLDLGEDQKIAINTFLSGVTQFIPSGITLQLNGEGDILNVETGALVGAYSVGDPISIPGTYAGTNWSAVTGACVRWTTGAVVGRRRLQGRTFLVPMAGCFDDNGGVNPADRATIDAAASAVYSGQPGLGIWHRPTALGGGADGAFRLITGGQTLAMATYLRTRRT